MGGEENEQMGIGQEWVCFDVEKEYGGDEDQVIWTPSKTAWKKTATGEDERQMTKGQTCKDLVPGCKRMDTAGHGGCIRTGKPSGKMAGKYHSSADSAT